MTMVPGNRVSILLVDDRPENLLDLEVMLGDLGHNLVRAESGQSALRHLLHEEFAVVLLDVAMPLMDGFETARHIRGRERTQFTPIIFVTAHDEDMKQQLEGYALGAVDYITKPISREILRAKVTVFVELFRNNQELKRLNERLQNSADEKLKAKNLELEHEIAERRKAEQRLEYLAHHDSLTGLPNRMLLLDRLRQAIAHAHRNKDCVGVLFMDLDRFKAINDALGHQLGDRLLKVVAQRLIEQIREGDTVARLGGDEFVAVLCGLGKTADACLVAEKILAAVGEPCRLDRHDLYPTPSIGIAAYPDHGDDPAILIRSADNAMYQAKAAGRNRCVVFNEEMAAAEDQRRALEAGLYGALARGEFQLRYQPTYDLTTGNLIGMEALLRWQHPAHGLLTPERFISIAEETGLVVPIGEWVLNTACRDLKAWKRAGVAPPRIAVNFSAPQFHQLDLASTVELALAANDLEPMALEIEVTESVLMQSTDVAIAALRRLSVLGVCVVMDDFGADYCSLSHLKNFPIGKLKIGKSLVQGLMDNPRDRAMVATIVSLAQGLGFAVSADGVDTHEQVDMLRNVGCFAGQGHLFGKELEASQQPALRTEALSAIAAGGEPARVRALPAK